MAAELGMSSISWAGSIDPIFLQSLLGILVFRTGFNDDSDHSDDIVKATLREFSSASELVSFDEAFADVNPRPA